MTNDNLDALRFYQRRGFVLTELHTEGVDQARTLKPEVPTVGLYGVPTRDELIVTRRMWPLRRWEPHRDRAETTTEQRGWRRTSRQPSPSILSDTS